MNHNIILQNLTVNWNLHVCWHGSETEHGVYQRAEELLENEIYLNVLSILIASFSQIPIV